MSWGWAERSPPRAAILVGGSFWAAYPGMARAGWLRGGCADWREAAEQASRALQDSGARCGVQVWLSGILCPAFWLSPPQDLRDGAEWHAWVSTVVAARHAGSGDDAAPLIWTESSRVRPTLATALPAACLQVLRASIGQHRLVSVKPLWSHAFAQIESRGGLGTQRWSAFDGETLTSVDVVNDVVTGAMTMDGVQDAARALAIHQRRAATARFDSSELFCLDTQAHARAFEPLWSEVPT